ncbi:hypothetical protein [Photobacterium angustum]|uniref:hypothetical protein n=1 Tax=Photobacterium angustum TaxID=661 RepID=UPI0005E29FAE|nr:hypothetical protein [Photobacterium angustum]KJF95127.1 hypothetical protein UB39_07090 [Photobacterium angustum]PSW81191.1 hypothetical protein CTN03_08770 [Photobacterium angustum]
MSTLKVLAVGIVMGNGTSMKSGSPKPYAFANVQYLLPAKDFSNENTNIQRKGMDVKEINMMFDQALFNSFGGLEFPIEIELVLSADPENPSRNIVTEFNAF